MINPDYEYTQWVELMLTKFGPHPQVRLLAMTAEHHIEGLGEPFPSVEALAQGMGVKPPTVRKYLRQAVDQGWLRVEGKGKYLRAIPSHLSNLYRLRPGPGDFISPDQGSR